MCNSVTRFIFQMFTGAFIVAKSVISLAEAR